MVATFDPVKDTPIPEEYQQHQKVFSDEEAQRFPPEREEDFPIKLRPDTPQKINCKIYPLTPKEDESLKAYIEENLAKGYIYKGSSPYASSFFFRKKTDGELRPIINYRPLNAVRPARALSPKLCILITSAMHHSPATCLSHLYLSASYLHCLIPYATSLLSLLLLLYWLV